MKQYYDERYTDVYEVEEDEIRRYVYDDEDQGYEIGRCAICDEMMYSMEYKQKLESERLYEEENKKPVHNSCLSWNVLSGDYSTDEKIDYIKRGILPE